jgi:hypothetical protein
MNDKLRAIIEANENIAEALKMLAEEESRNKSKALPRGHDYRHYSLEFDAPRFKKAKSNDYTFLRNVKSEKRKGDTQ